VRGVPKRLRTGRISRARLDATYRNRSRWLTNAWRSATSRMYARAVAPRGRHTPYKAQLDRYLADKPGTPFSARSLADSFENGSRDEHGMLRGIQEVLAQAYNDGRLVQFFNAEGQPLTESPGHEALPNRLRAPVIYALPGVAPPTQDYEPAAFDPGGHPDATSARVEGGSAPGDEADAGNSDDPADHPEQPEPAATALTIEEALKRLASFPPPGSAAPSWLDTHVLSIWLSLPGAAEYFRRGLDKARGDQRLALIRSGVNRKQRGAFSRNSVVVGNLAELCRTDDAVWYGTAHTAIAHYLAGDDGLDPAELAALVADPLDVYDSSEIPPEAVLLAAMALEVDESVLEIIASDVASAVPDADSDTSTQHAERIDALKRSEAELRRTAKEADKERKASAKRVGQLEAELETVRAASDGESTADAQLRLRADSAEKQVAPLRSEIPELEAQVQSLEEANDHLERQATAAREDRLLREQAEQDAARNIQRVRELTEQLTQLSDSRNLPIDDPVALVTALARPIGQAARHAAERLAGGRIHPHDHLLLELASMVTQIGQRLEMTTDTQVEGVTPAVDDTPAPDTNGVADVPAALPARDGIDDSDLDSDGAVQPASSEPPAISTPDDNPAPLPGRRRRRASRLIVRPLGGAGEVGGSALLVKNASGHTVLLDCGQRVKGEYGLETEAQFHRRVGEDGRLHAILISHAHIDHVGSLPILHREQSESQDTLIPVYMTKPTRHLAQIMLEDSAKIQQSKAESAADLGYVDYGTGSMEAAYRVSDVMRVMDDEVTREVDAARAVQIPDTSFVARFLPVAHVLGSCAIHLTDTENDQTLLYTGDLGPISDPQITLPQYSLQEMLGADLVVMESTYGRPLAHEAEGKRRRGLSGREQAVQQLFDAVSHAHEHGGSVLLPAFSLGRTQELAKIIHQGRTDGGLPAGGKIWIAGMGEKIVQVYDTFSRGTNPWARADDMPRTEELGKLVRGGVRFEDAVSTVLDEGFSFIIASPAMLTSGWSRQFLVNMISDPRHSIVLSGYLPRHSGGIPHLHRLAAGEKINLDGDMYTIRARWEKAGLSAHAPSGDLRKFAEYMTRQTDHVSFGMVHGEEAAQLALAEDVSQYPTATAESLSNGQPWRPQRPG
jgi:Cft2 family RNA processing exonuclease